MHFLSISFFCQLLLLGKGRWLAFSCLRPLFSTLLPPTNNMNIKVAIFFFFSSCHFWSCMLLLVVVSFQVLMHISLIAKPGQACSRQFTNSKIALNAFHKPNFAHPTIRFANEVKKNTCQSTFYCMVNVNFDAMDGKGHSNVSGEEKQNGLSNVTSQMD